MHVELQKELKKRLTMKKIEQEKELNSLKINSKYNFSNFTLTTQERKNNQTKQKSVPLPKPSAQLLSEIINLSPKQRREVNNLKARHRATSLLPKIKFQKNNTHIRHQDWGKQLEDIQIRRLEVNKVNTFIVDDSKQNINDYTTQMIESSYLKQNPYSLHASPQKASFKQNSNCEYSYSGISKTNTKDTSVNQVFSLGDQNSQTSSQKQLLTFLPNQISVDSSILYPKPHPQITHIKLQKQKRLQKEVLDKLQSNMNYQFQHQDSNQSRFNELKQLINNSIIHRSNSKNDTKMSQKQVNKSNLHYNLRQIGQTNSDLLPLGLQFNVGQQQKVFCVAPNFAYESKADHKQNPFFQQSKRNMTQQLSSERQDNEMIGFEQKEIQYKQLRENRDSLKRLGNVDSRLNRKTSDQGQYKLINNQSQSSITNKNSKTQTTNTEDNSPNKIKYKNRIVNRKMKTMVKIYHEDYHHLDNHPINEAISKINSIIKLIFKNNKDTNQNEYSGLPPQLVEEKRLIEIKKIAKQFLNIQIPKKYDSKISMKEYFISKEFILIVKSKINTLLQKVLNESNEITELLQQVDQKQQTNNNIQVSQRFYIGRGNNAAIVKNIIRQRYWWIKAEEEDFNEATFIWTQWKKQQHIDFLTNNNKNDIEKGLCFYNRMEQNKQLTNKKGIFINMRSYYESLECDPFNVLPLTFLVKNGINDEEFKKFEDQYQQLNDGFKNLETTRKQKLKERALQIKQENLKRRKEKKTNSIQAIFKQKQNSSDEEVLDEEDEESNNSDYENDSEIQEIKKAYRSQKNIWIIKPGENTNRGNGINVSSNLNEIKQIITRTASNPSTKDRTFIIQKYIDYPLLINNRKFDFRCYGLLTSINGNLKGYFYDDAYIRTSCKEYDTENLSSKYIHLTNDAIQQKSEDFGKYENGNKMSLQDFQKYLKQKFPEINIDVQKHIMTQIKKIITDTFRATYSKIDPQRLCNTFELLGYDFMIDDDFKLYLIEVNTNPCLEIGCPLLARIIPEVIDNTFRIVLDPVYPSPDLSSNRKYSINEIPQEIKYTLVFDEKIDKQQCKVQQTQEIDEIESDKESELIEEDSAEQNEQSEEEEI